MTPSEQGGDSDIEQDEQSAPKRVRVPIRRGDGVFQADEHAEVDADVAGQWDARQWRDRPL